MLSLEVERKNYLVEMILLVVSGRFGFVFSLIFNFGVLGKLFSFGVGLEMFLGFFV